MFNCFPIGQAVGYSSSVCSCLHIPTPTTTTTFYYTPPPTATEVVTITVIRASTVATPELPGQPSSTLLEVSQVFNTPTLPLAGGTQGTSISTAPSVPAQTGIAPVQEQAQFTTVTLQYAGSTTRTSTITAPSIVGQTGTVLVEVPAQSTLINSLSAGASSTASATAALPYQTSTTYGSLTYTTTISTVAPSGTAAGTYIVQQPLPTWLCSSSAVLVQENTVYSVNTSTSNITQLGPTVNNVPGAAYLNNIGYNVADNYIYGVTTGSPPYLFRLGSNSQFVTLSTVSAAVSTTGVWNAGEVDTNSQLWLFSGSTHWARVSLTPANFGSVVASGITTAPADINDWVYLTAGGQALWSVNLVSSILSNSIRILRFDETAHTWSTFATYSLLTGNTATNFNAIWAVSSTSFQASDHATGQVWEFSISGAAPRLVGTTSSPGNYRDGARCALA